MQTITVKDLADTCGVSKVAISKRIEALGLKSELIKDGTRNLVPMSVAEKVIAYYQNRQTTKEEKSADADSTKRAERNPDFASTVELMNQQIESLNKQIELLKQQLETKDRQIEKFQEDSKGFMSVILSQQQQLMLNQPNGAVVDAVEVEHEEGTPIRGDDSDPYEKEPKRTLFSRFFR